MNSRRTLLLAAGAASAAPFISLAQPAFPARPVRIIIPFAAGGPTDVVARLIADRLSALMGQPFVVDARPGGGGAIAAEAVARASSAGPSVSTIGTRAIWAIGAKLVIGSKGSLRPGIDGLTAWVVAVPISKVWPSGAARATASAAIAPPPPGRASTTKG